MKNTGPFLHCISNFEGTSYTNLHNRATRSFISFFYLVPFTSVDIIFHKLLELHSTFSEKKIFVPDFPFLFLTDSLKPSHFLNDQKLQSLTKVFVMLP